MIDDQHRRRALRVPRARLRERLHHRRRRLAHVARQHAPREGDVRAYIDRERAEGVLARERDGSVSRRSRFVASGRARNSIEFGSFTAHLFDAIARDVVPSAERAMRARVVGRGGGHGRRRRPRATVSGVTGEIKYLFDNRVGYAISNALARLRS